MRALADLGVVNALLSTVPNAAHDITAGNPKAKLRRTRRIFPVIPDPNKVPKEVIRTRK